ncbi:phage portal protein [Dysgonomonas sp. GY617]|uniref:phage portal protein n=1 Tax=Dysgonomonas sp. GY617 TaxID=2780420 RepID=UPI0018840012|nr:phage portal protein [Dysgonomonas sp. GY617]MBF0577732.1 phage portal protein [Dysgonomonas sp. GY617]
MKKWYKIWERNTVSPPEPTSPKGYFETVNSADNLVTEWVNGGDSREINVTSPNLAMKISAVYRCVDILSGSIASLPLQLKVKKEGVFQIAENNTLNYLLTVKANQRQNAFDMMQNAIIQMVLYGNAYILPVYTLSGELNELILLSPNTTTYNVIMNSYYVNDMINGVIDEYDSDEIIHLRNISLDGGYTGVSTIQYAARVLGISANADERTLDSFKPGKTLKGFISGDRDAGVKGFGEMQDSQLEDVEKRITNEVNSGKGIFRVPGAAKFSQLSIPYTDLQLLETRKFGILDVCRFFGVHPDKVFAGQSQNYKASAVSNESYLSDTLQSRLVKIETEYRSKLIPKSLIPKMKIEFDIESLLLTSLEQQANYIEKTVQNGVYTPNYWREKKGQLPKEGGDELFISCNVAPINSTKIRGEDKNLPPKNE